MTTNTQTQQPANEPHPNRLFWVALALGILAAVFQFMGSSQGTKFRVYKARQTVRAGSKVDLTQQFLPVTIYGDDNQLKEMRALIVDDNNFQVFRHIPLAETLAPGQLLFQSSFFFEGNRGIRDKIGKDERAVAVSVDNARSVAGIVRPGDRVDVRILKGAGRTVEEPDLPATLVLAVDDNSIIAGDSGGRDNPYSTVTLLVPENKIGRFMSDLTTAGGQVYLDLLGRTAE